MSALEQVAPRRVEDCAITEAIAEWEAGRISLTALEAVVRRARILNERAKPTRRTNPHRPPDGRAARQLAKGTPIHDDYVELTTAFEHTQRGWALKMSSIKARRDKLHLLAEFLYPKSLLEATAGEIVAFLDGRQLTPRTRYAYCSHIHAFYLWALDEGRLDADPTATIRRPRLPRLVPRPIADADLDHALMVAPPRLRAMMALAAFQGLRAGEIARLGREDVLDMNDPPVLIVDHGKGGHQRVVPLNEHALIAMRLAGMPRSGPIFKRADNGQALTPGAVSRLVNTYLHSLGIAATIHQLRHWFGSKLYQESHDLRMTQELLGHSSPSTTAGYAAWSVENGAQAVRALAPPSGRLTTA